MDKLNARDEQRLKREAERLIRTKRMPSLDELCKTVLETRKEFAVKIRRARREARGAFVKPN